MFTIGFIFPYICEFNKIVKTCPCIYIKHKYGSKYFDVKYFDFCKYLTSQSSSDFRKYLTSQTSSDLNSQVF